MGVAVSSGGSETRRASNSFESAGFLEMKIEEEFWQCIKREVGSF